MNRPSPERWHRIERLIDAALDEETEVREEDADIRAEAARLLDFRDQAERFLSHPPDAFAARALAGSGEVSEAAPSEPPPERIGPYRVLGEAGRGGMATVYLAERDDPQLHHRVAVKVVRDAIASGAVVRRFLHERQILASLDHPGIARLLDGGVTESGVPWFAMEFVAGEPITRYCNDKRLGVEERLELFLRVCDAVQYAHRNLVVHRDLKPTNILVTEPAPGEATGRVKLLDFGIARLLDPDPEQAGQGLTRTGATPLTPAYASPEQLRGEPVATASDVYQLGVLLYELLAGRHPYPVTGLALHGVLKVVLEGSLTAPSAAVAKADASVSHDRASAPERLRRRLQGDLDTIVLTAMQKEPDRRYGSVERLADDVRRHLAGEGVSARPDTLTYRAGKFIRRHRVGVAMTAMTFVLLATFAGTMAVQARRIARERDRAEAVTTFLSGLFTSADPASTRGDTVTVRDLLDRGAERVRAELNAQPAVQATLMETIGEVYANLGLYQPAVSLLEDAVTLRRSGGARSDRALGRSLRLLAMIDVETGRFDAAAPLLTEALARLDGASPRGTAEHAIALTDIAFGWQAQGQRALAESLLTIAVAEFEQLDEPTMDMARAFTNLSYLLVDRGALDSAEHIIRRSVEIRRLAGGPDHPALANSLEGLARVLSRKGGLVAADSAAREALDIRRRVLPEGAPLIAATMALRGNILYRQGRLADAESLARQGLAMRVAALGEDHFVVAFSRNGLAAVLQDQGRLREAEALFRAALAGYQRQFGTEHLNTAIVELNLARLMARTGARDEAIRRFHHAVPIARANAPGDRNILSDLALLGNLRCTRDPPRALEDLREAADSLRPHADSSLARDDYLQALLYLGECLARQGRAEEARQALTMLLEGSAHRPADDALRIAARRQLSELESPRR